MSVEEKNPIVIYWSPFTSPEVPEIGDWNMLYPEPELLWVDLAKTKNPHVENSIYPKGTTFFSCPAVSTRLRHTYVFRNALHTEYYFDNRDENNPIVQVTTKRGVGATTRRPSGFKGGMSVEIYLKFLFFSEEPITAMINPPFMHQPEHGKAGTAIPGGMDINGWFRPYVFEIQTYKNQGTIVIPENDPLFYLEVMTDRKIILKRFAMNHQLFEYAQSCSKASERFEKNRLLPERYKMFRQSRTNELVLSEIKKTLL